MARFKPIDTSALARVRAYLLAHWELRPLIEVESGVDYWVLLRLKDGSRSAPSYTRVQAIAEAINRIEAGAARRGAKGKVRAMR